MKREVWFAYRGGLLAFGWPVHWKGWVLNLVFIVVISGIFAADSLFGTSVDPATRSVAFWGGVALAAAVFTILAWPHRGYPN